MTEREEREQYRVGLLAEYIEDFEERESELKGYTGVMYEEELKIVRGTLDYLRRQRAAIDGG